MAFVRKEKGTDDARPAKRKAVKASDVAAEKFTLASELTVPSTDLGDAIILIAGLRKIGKTSLATQFGKTLVMAAEIGYKGLRLYKEDIPNWERAMLVAKSLRKDKTFKSVAIDTVDKMYRKCEDFTCQQMGITYLGDADYGKGWSENRKNFVQLVDMITHTGKGVIFISHTEEREVRERSGNSYTVISSSMAKQARSEVEALADIMAYYQYLGGRRVLTILGDDVVPAGHRYADRFRTPSGQRIRHIDMGRNEREGYNNFVAAFNNRYEPDDDSDIAEEDNEPTPKKRKKFSLKGK